MTRKKQVGYFFFGAEERVKLRVDPEPDTLLPDGFPAILIGQVAVAAADFLEIGLEIQL